MVFIWRGFGLSVPIIFGICLWICSYWFDDLRLGNWDYTGWAMFWTGCVSLIIGAILKFGFSDVEDMKREPGEVMPDKRRHDFFWIPVWLWGLLLIVLGLWTQSNDSSFTSSADDDEIKPEEIAYKGERMIWFYNPNHDTVYLEVNNASGESELADSLAAGAIKWSLMDAGIYNFKHDLGSEKVEILGAESEDSTSYDDGWYVIGGEFDLLLLDVNAACRKDIDKEEMAEIDWSSKVKKRYKGEAYLLPKLKSREDRFYKVYRPGQTLPLELRENEQVYLIVAIHEDAEITEEFLNQEVIWATF